MDLHRYVCKSYRPPSPGRSGSRAPVRDPNVRRSERHPQRGPSGSPGQQSGVRSRLSGPTGRARDRTVGRQIVPGVRHSCSEVRGAVPRPRDAEARQGRHPPRSPVTTRERGGGSTRDLPRRSPSDTLRRVWCKQTSYACSLRDQVGPIRSETGIFTVCKRQTNCGRRDGRSGDSGMDDPEEAGRHARNSVTRPRGSRV